jgi:hypothetical protein
VWYWREDIGEREDSKGGCGIGERRAGEGVVLEPLSRSWGCDKYVIVR